MNFKNLTLCIILWSACFASQAQVRRVNYKVQFNPVTNLFDCYIVVKEGKASKMIERIQFNSQYTIVVPAGSEVKVANYYMPIENNQNYDGVKPAKWNISNKILKPASDPFNDYISIVPSLTPISLYNDLKEGDEVKLFSLSIFPIVDCGASVRPFDKSIDLSSRDTGMKGGDFSNGFTVGGLGQKYASNVEPQLATIPAIEKLNHQTKNGIDIQVGLSAQMEQANIEWYGPNGYYHKGEKVHIVAPSNELYGTYKAVVTDKRGCKDERSIEIKNPNQTLQEVVKTEINTNHSKNVPSLDKNIRTLTNEDVHIYPNPASGIFNVNLTAYAGADLKMDIADNTGRIVKSNLISTTLTQTNFEANFNVVDLSPGVYNLNIILDGQHSSHRLIIVK